MNDTTNNEATTIASGPAAATGRRNGRNWGWAAGALAAGAAIVALSVPAGATGSSGTSDPASGASNPTDAAVGTPDCDGHWPLVENGRPDDFSADADGGAYIWHNTDGWHLRVTHQGNNRRVFTGRVSADTVLRDHKVADEAHDKLSKAPKSFTFVFNNYGAIDGVDFKTNCASVLNFDLRVDGHRLPVQRISLGDNAKHPSSNPFAIHRVG